MALKENETANPIGSSVNTDDDDSDAKDIYFVITKGMDHVKIGLCAPGRVAARLAALQTGSSLPLHIVGIVPNMSALYEKMLHTKFAKYRMHGEWFRLSDEIKLFILANCMLPDPDAQNGKKFI